MKKWLLTVMLIVGMCVMTGCGNKDKVDNAENQAIGFQKDARESVEEQNEQVWELEDTAKQLEEEIE